MTGTITHRGFGFDAADLAASLAEHRHVDVYGGRLKSATLAFTLCRAGRSVLIVDPSGQHLGTFACPAAAARHGFHCLDAAADQQRAIHPRPPRARRRTTQGTPIR